MMGGLEDENGRETGGNTNFTPVPPALCTSAFETSDGSMGGTFSNASVYSTRFIQ